MRTRRWLSFTLTAIVAIAAFGFLSHWQWGRAHEEDAKANSVVAGAEQAPAELDTVLLPGEPLSDQDRWRPVTTSGVLDCAAGFLVRNRPLDGTNGLWAVCPLQTADGAWVWVNRGWLPASGPAATEVPMPQSPAGVVQITGNLRASESAPARVPSDLPPGQAAHLDTAVLAAAAGLTGPGYEPYISVVGMVPADPGSLKPLPLPASDSAQNYSYAGQWLLFAAITIGGWGYFLRREAQEDRLGPPAQQQAQPAR